MLGDLTTIGLGVGHPSPQKELDSPFWCHLWLNWSEAYRFLECSLSLQTFYCLNFSVLTKSWWFLIDERPNRPGVHLLLSIFVAGCFPGDSGGIEPICQFRTHRRLGIKVWSLGQEDRLEEGKTTYSIIVAWRIPWTENPGGLQSMGMHWVRYDWSDWAHVYLQLNYDSRLRHMGRSKMGVERGWFGKGSVFWKLYRVVPFTSLFLPLVLWWHTGGGKTTMTAFARSRCPH